MNLLVIYLKFVMELSKGNSGSLPDYNKYKPSISPLYIRWAYRGLIGDYERAMRGLILPDE
ncbi:hypothetical protein [Chitinophaga sp. YR573]|uniref:hypothetical protein n=1 Tax=Chitinophaga sp. YR573 TaxID=1881040 RepID=UPI000B7DA0B1|nr:hypothetical protein [Chitinophaga sp. YR573]